MDLIKANRLMKGDTIGIVSVSAPEAKEQKERFEKGINYLKKCGYNVVLSEHVMDSNGYITSTPEKMAADLMNMFKNDSVKCILCAGGGLNANTILQYLDYDVIKDNPKIFVGVSNPTVVLNAINTKTGLITFHGPAIVWDFGEDNGLCKFTDEHLWSELSDGIKAHDIVDKEHNWISLKDGKAVGVLVGGNLVSIQTLLGTEYEPDWNGKVLFWEDICKSVDKIDLMLTHFKDVGALKKLKGMIVGELVSCEPNDKEIYNMVLERLMEYDFPVIANVPFGHTQDKLTLPIGAKVSFDTTKLGKIRVKESVVKNRK
ncbi:MAG: LD-carboxypeptidase [Bacilli bacterium]|nr:LD-carboxypeptidase [Bacilli bacterium]